MSSVSAGDALAYRLELTSWERYGRVAAATSGPCWTGRVRTGRFQHLGPVQRRAVGEGVSALANPGATLLMLEFPATPLRSVVGGVSPQWCRFRRPAHPR